MSLGDLIYYIITDRPVKVLVPEHTEALRLIATMSNNINQLAVKANSLGFVDAPQLKKEAESVYSANHVGCLE